ncbi:MAG: hypothetical protein KDD63_07955 [Bacteroidetes bacterium]|nr:hypothetical protein [Bacteroidota bacterium]
MIENEISDQSFDTWFKPIKPVKFEKNILTIEVPSQFFFFFLEENYLGMLKSGIHA